MHYPSRNALLYLFVGIFGVASTVVGWQDLMESRRPWYSGFFSSTPTAKFSSGSYQFQFSLSESERGNSEATDTLTISQFGRDEVLELSTGDSFLLNNATARVIAVRPYVGLWPDPLGVPMAGISIRRNGVWTENITLQSGGRLAVQNGLAIQFLWCADEAEARRRADEGRPGIESARWGVRDTTRTHWSNSFTPGTGVELADGTFIRLLGLEEDNTAIEVEIRRDDDVTRRRILPNADDPLVLFDLPAFEEDILSLFAWSEGWARLSYLPQRAESVQVDIPVGGEWEGGGEGVAIRLEQISNSALQVSPSGLGLFEAVLEIGGLRVRAREGQALRVGDALLRYSRDRTDTTERYPMAFKSSGGEEIRFVLTPQTPFLFSTPGGNFSLRYRDVHPGVGVRVRQKDRGLPYRLSIGIVVLGLVSVAVARRPKAAR